ncbi:MAG: hypothetical protein EBR09_02935 [Proteobacteria bacterium]|nr:hypothetical protein [Pseudomonadota bacterium]
MKIIALALITQVFVIGCGQKNDIRQETKTENSPVSTEENKPSPLPAALSPEARDDTKITPERFIRCNPENFTPLGRIENDKQLENDFAFNFVPEKQDEGTIKMSVWGWQTECRDGIHKIPQYGVYPTSLVAKKEANGEILLFVQNDRSDIYVGTIESGRPEFCRNIENCTFLLTRLDRQLTLSIKINELLIHNEIFQLAGQTEFIPIIAGAFK